jgi:hypothetical protein
MRSAGRSPGATRRAHEARVHKGAQKTVFFLVFTAFYPLFTMFSVLFSPTASPPSLQIPFSRKPFRKGVYGSARFGGRGVRTLFAPNFVAGARPGPHLPPSQSNIEAGATQQGNIELGAPPVAYVHSGPDTPRLRVIHQKSPRPPRGVRADGRTQERPAALRWRRMRGRAQLSKNERRFTGPVRPAQTGRAASSLQTYQMTARSLLYFPLFSPLLSKRQGGVTTRGDKEG